MGFLNLFLMTQEEIGCKMQSIRNGRELTTVNLSISLFRSLYYTTETKQCFMLIETKTGLIGQKPVFCCKSYFIAIVKVEIDGEGGLPSDRISFGQLKNPIDLLKSRLKEKHESLLASLLRLPLLIGCSLETVLSPFKGDGSPVEKAYTSWTNRSVGQPVRTGGGETFHWQPAAFGVFIRKVNNSPPLRNDLQGRPHPWGRKTRALKVWSQARSGFYGGCEAVRVCQGLAGWCIRGESRPGPSSGVMVDEMRLALASVPQTSYLHQSN
ncbi:hypothetical protein DPX16_18478 [Anabarilius grahami]|uniref:Uncharacterized protein n=1 Tax=Anabarilius grahami TaxID=495550 RepID=A0A3N0YF25_ANAGA|nr:hypothetical protein DPX16_18478 [Anabarilius grahami]